MAHARQNKRTYDSAVLEAEAAPASPPRPALRVVPPEPRWRRILRQPRWPTLLLFLLALTLHLHDLNDRPGYPHFFEDNPLTRIVYEGLTPREVLAQPWDIRYRVLREWGNGDTDHVGMSWPWITILDRSRRLFGETPFAHRLPSAILAALSPVLFYHLVRGYFRPKQAFLCGLLLATSPLHLTFARNGGYVGPTLTLLLGLFYLSLRIGVDDRRRAWIGFTALLLLIPYAYAPSRYLGLIAFLPMGVSMWRSAVFRRRHLPCLAGAVVLWLAAAIPNVAAKNAWMQDWGKATVHAAQMFYNASGEQFFSAGIDMRPILVHEIGRSENAAEVDYEDPAEVARKLIVLRIKQWWSLYWMGERLGLKVSDDPPALYDVARMWPPLVLPALATLGLGYCTWRSVRERRFREMMLVAWSVCTWLPLLLTTQVNGNRTLVGIPPDLYFVAVGLMWIVQPMRARVSRLRRPLLDGVLLALLAIVLTGRVNHYFGALP
jgi:4-amino-4-deoxy-L-arabinose transferase-like glycosyltransferase